MAPTPASPGRNTSLLTVWYHPPSPSSNVAAPSGKTCHSYPLSPTGSPATATTRELKPGGRMTPFSSGAMPSRLP